MVGTIVKWGAAAAGAVLAWKYLVQPWRARRAVATRAVKVVGTPSSSAMKQAVDDVYAALAKLKISGSVGNGTYDGAPAVLVKPDNRAMVPRLVELLPDRVRGVRVAVV